MAEADNSGGGLNNRWSLKGMTALVTVEPKDLGMLLWRNWQNSAPLCIHAPGTKQSSTNVSMNGKPKASKSPVRFLTCRLDRNERIDERGLLPIQWQTDQYPHRTNVKKPTVEFNEEDFSSLMATNFESAYHLTQLAHPLLKASKAGSIVFMSFVCGVVSVSVGSIYGEPKGAMNQLARNLACEWAKDNIRTNSVAPWFIQTPLAEPLLSDEKFNREVISRTPHRRAEGGIFPSSIFVPAYSLLHEWTNHLC